MLFALAVLLIQPQVNAHLAFSAEKIAFIQPAISSLASTHTQQRNFSGIDSGLCGRIDSFCRSFRFRGIAERSRTGPCERPIPECFPEIRQANDGIRWPVARRGAPQRPSLDGTWNRGTQRPPLLTPGRRRRAITSAGAQELNPMLKPFAGNASLYAVIQVGPLMMDYVGRKMLYSRHSWVRPCGGSRRAELCQFAVLWRPQLGCPLEAQIASRERKKFLPSQSQRGGPSSPPRFLLPGQNNQRAILSGTIPPEESR